MKKALHIITACAHWGFATASAPPTRSASPADLIVPEGLEVTLWAESPLFFKPTSLDVDARGRIWVAEGVNYRTFRGRDANQPDMIPFRHPGGDRIMILEDTDGDGRADSSKVFVQDKDLVAPLGVAVIGNRVFVSCSPHLLVYTLDASGDKPAKREIFLTGFGGHDHDHGLHSVVAGPDGRLYFNAGNAGPHRVTDRDGRTIRAGSCYTGGSPYNTTNTPNLKSDDGRVWTGGLALRIDPDGRHLTPLAHNFRNSYEVAIDSFGDLWQNDNDDEVRSCRTSWVMEGANMGFFSADGTRTWRADQRPGQPAPIAHWHQDDPGVLPAGDIYGAGGPTGVVVYEGELLPSFQGVVLDCDAGRNTVFAHRSSPAGAGFRLERSVFLSSQRGSTAGYVWNQVSFQDRSTWFRPSDVVVGTDEAVYIADWQDAVVGGHAMRSTNGYGRILRITPKGAKPHPPRLDLSTRSGLLAAMQSPAINVRFAARQQLLANPAEANAVIEALAGDTNPVFRARAAWLPGRWEKALHDPDERVRVAAWRAARQQLAGSPDKLATVARRFVSAAAPALQREVALALRDAPFDKASPLLFALAKRQDGKDRFSLEAFGIGCWEKEEMLYPLLLTNIGHADALKWSEAFAAIVWRLHPVASVTAVAQRARSSSLTLTARLQAVDTLAFIADRAAAEAMLAVAVSGPEEISRRAQWWARFRANNDWKTFGVAARLPGAEPSAAEFAAHAQLQSQRRTLLDASAPAREREQAARNLAATETGGLALVKLAAGGQLPAQFREAVAEVIFRNPSPAVRALASPHFPRPSRSGETFPAIAELLKRRGDPVRGAKIFASATAACVSCHAFRGQGGAVGPDLTMTRTKLGREGTLDAILNPSAVIAAGYEPWLIETRDGEVYSGLMLADGDVLTLKESSGVTRTIPAREIASRQQLKLSLMPDNIALGLTPGELVDLLEYLLAGPSPINDVAPASAATPPEKLTVPAGFKVELLCSPSPDKEGSWVSLCADPRGRLYASGQYDEGLFRITPPPLGSAAGATRIEKLPVKLSGAQGLCWAFGNLYALVSKNGKAPSGLYQVSDLDSDDVPETVKLLRALEGGGDHGWHGILPHPDGKSLCVVAGNNTTPPQLASSRVPPHFSEDHLLPRLPDAGGHMKGVLAPGGVIYRVSPDGHDWEMLANGFRNTYDAAFNHDGELFTYDADMEWDMGTPWYRSTRICLVPSGAEFGWRNGTGKWAAYQPDSLPGVLDMGPGSPTGVTFGHGARFPARYQEALFAADWTFGRIYAVHLRAKGSAYEAEREVFVSGVPLPVVDLVVLPSDGALYFITGGWRIQTGLYRVTYERPIQKEPAAAADTGKALRATRHELESFHGRRDPAAVSTAWPALGHEDRFLDFAARVALEWQDPSTWRARALAEQDPATALSALLALVRTSSRDEFHRKATDPAPETDLKARVLAALERFEWNGGTGITRSQPGTAGLACGNEASALRLRLALLRAYTLCFTRLGRPDDEVRDRLLARLEPCFPAKDRALNSELCQLLVYLQSPRVAAPALELVQAAPTQEEQLDYIKSLRMLRAGWTPRLRREYFAWFNQAAGYRGGASFAGFLKMIRADAMATLSESEQQALSDVLKAAGPVSPMAAFSEALAGRTNTTEWTMAALTPALEHGLGGRDFERGRRMFGATGCFQCHRFAGEGGAIGPDLTQVAGRFSPRELLEAILEPSRTVSDLYGNVIISRRDGQSFTGRIVYHTPDDSVMVSPSMFSPAETVKIGRKDILQIEPSPISPMPEGLLALLTQEEVLDLLAYLVSGGSMRR